MMDYVSLVVTSLNRLELLERSLNSLWQNTDFPYELIVHDDGSEPAVQDWLTKKLHEGKISELILEPTGHNRGNGVSVDRAIACSTGDWICKLDGDEQFFPGWLSEAVRTLELWPQIRLLHCSEWCDYHLRDTPGEYLTYPNWPFMELYREYKEGLSVSVVWVGPGEAFLFSRETYKEFGPWDSGMVPSTGEDAQFRMRCCQMMRLFQDKAPRIRLAGDPSAETQAVLRAKHWEQHKDTPWLAAMNPPTVSYHWGDGRSARFDAWKTQSRHPLLLGVQT